MFLIPDAILELMTCDNCHKFLSAGPVKVYRNRTTKCGRCVKENDGGAISQYGSMVEHGLFKCVNRFDGCRQVLAYDEVFQHESNCGSKAYACPICPKGTSVPTFLMIRHFTEKHPNRLLKKPSFKVDINSTSESFLYRNKDDLFFVECVSSLGNVLRLDVYFLGGSQEADKIKVRFEVHDGLTDKTDIRVRRCKSYSYLKSSGGSPMKPLAKSDSVFVAFNLLRQVTGEFINFPTSKTNTEIVSNVLERIHIRSREMTDVYEWRVNLMKRNRKVSLSIPFQKKHPDFQVDCNSSSLLRIVDQKPLKITPFCHNCSVPTPLRQNWLGIGPSEYQVLCWLCEKYYETQDVQLRFIRNEEWFHYPTDLFVLYTCLWECGGSFPWHQIVNHEIYCRHQQDQQCPVPHCNYSGKLESFVKHFKDLHPSNEISLYPRIIVGRPSFPCSAKIYLWVSRAFVSLDFRWDREQYHITVGQNACGWVSPRAMVFIDDWANFLAVVSRGQTFAWKNEEWLYIKCFLGSSDSVPDVSPIC